MALDAGERERLTGYLSRYPVELLELLAGTGFKMCIFADYPQPEGKLRPSSLGVGDHNQDGKVNPNDWVDTNGNGKPDPWEYEGKWGIPDASGKMHTLDLDRDIDGAYLPDRNCLYLFKSLASEGRWNSGLYTAIHEMAHAIDFNLQNDPRLGPQFSATADALFAACQEHVPGHEFFYSYQAVNRYEFLACAMQAYLTPEHLVEETGKFDIRDAHRECLQEKDPATFRFVESFLQHPLEPAQWATATAASAASPAAGKG